MTREDVIRLSYAANNGNLSSSEASALLLYIESTMFVIGLGRMPELLAYCISYTLGWYERKYAINKLYSAPNPMDLGNGRRIILIH